jgi:DNA-binding NarL/FixJ family response regulator
MQKRILIVDDSDATRGLVREFLESRPEFEVCGEAADGVEGIEKGRELKPDLIVLDYSLPRINGLQVAVYLHEVVPNTPIILFTVFKMQSRFGWRKRLVSLRLYRRQINSLYWPTRSKD